MNLIPYNTFLQKLSSLSLALYPGQNVIFFDLKRCCMQMFQWHVLGFAFEFNAPFSYSKYGISQKENSLGTPIGIHTICEKIGQDVPLNGEFIARKFTGRIISQTQDLNQKARILTRILRLKGCEYGLNLGYDENHFCCDTYKRYVYIHGTNFETFIPNPLSHGCLLLKNEDLIYLFNNSHTGDFCYIF